MHRSNELEARAAYYAGTIAAGIYNASMNRGEHTPFLEAWDIFPGIKRYYGEAPEAAPATEAPAMLFDRIHVALMGGHATRVIQHEATPA